MSITLITTAEEIAHPETEATVQARVDPDLIADPEKNIKTIASIGTIDHAHITKNINPTPEIDIIHLIKSITTIDKDPEATLMPNTKTTTEIDPLKKRIQTTKKIKQPQQHISPKSLCYQYSRIQERNTR